ncbi:leucine-rich repeat-containing protein 70-like [Centruroides vittatus]|uniref:leucine-rich repeat-containing protein 70-like n=1 Tax=Centruroides vittatus TaxID=120091 RepID=UPI00350FC5F0
MKSLILVYVISFYIEGNGKILKNSCPPPEDLTKCYCSPEEPTFIDCSNVINPKEFIKITEILSEYQVKYLKIKDSDMLYLPNDSFLHLHITSLGISDSKILDLQNNTFRGLEKSLNTLSVSNITGISSWNWNALKDLDSLSRIIVLDSKWKGIQHKFPHLNSLTEITFRSNGIRHIAANAFENLDNLKHLDLQSNEIHTIHRDLLPDPATNLENINLNKNEIEFIPDDFLLNIPRLKIVFMAENKIKFLSPKVFRPLLLEQRFFFDLQDNDICCNMDLASILKVNLKDHVSFSCNHPEELKDEFFWDLTLNDLKNTNC